MDHSYREQFRASFEDFGLMLHGGFPMSNQQSTIPAVDVCDDVTLSPVISAGFGVNEDTKQLRGILLEADLEFGLDLVHARKRQTVRQRAVA